jgi:hypothetical protein
MTCELWLIVGGGDIPDSGTGAAGAGEDAVGAIADAGAVTVT